MKFLRNLVLLLFFLVSFVLSTSPSLAANKRIIVLDQKGKEVIDFDFKNNGASMLFQVKLSEKPTSNVDVAITQAGAATIRVADPPDITKLTFTPTNWNNAQKITLRADGGLNKDDTVNLTFSSPGYTSATLGVKAIADKSYSLSSLLKDPNGFVIKSWIVVRAIINSLLIIALLLIAITNITRVNIDTYAVKKTLPGLVIGVILANASLLIVRFLVDLNTVVVYFFVNQAGMATLKEFITGSITLLTLDSIKTIGTGAEIVSPLIVLVLAIIVIIGLLWLALLLYVRLVVIYLLTIISPLAFLCYGIPGLDKFFKQWWQYFVKWLFMLTAMAAIFWLMLAILGTNTEQSIARTLIGYILFFFALSIPIKWGSGVNMGKISQNFMKYTGAGALKNTGITAAKDAGRWAGYRVPGVMRVQEWNKIRKDNFEKDLSNLRARAAVNASGGILGRKSAREQLMAQEIANEKGRNDARNMTQAQKKLLDKVNKSDFEKREAESQQKLEQAESKVKFINDKKNKDIIESFVKASSQETAYTEALSSEEKKIIGNWSTGRYNALKAANEYFESGQEIESLQKKKDDWIRTKGIRSWSTDSEAKKIESALKTQQDRRALAPISFEKNKVNYDDLKDLTIEQVSEKLGKKEDATGKMVDNDPVYKALFIGEMKKQGKAFTGGVKAENEDDIKDATASMLTRSMDDLVDKIGDAIKESKADPNTLERLFSGKTLGIDKGFQRDFIVLTDTMKEIGRNLRDPRSNEVLQNLARAITVQGKQTIKYLDHNRVPQSFDSSSIDDLVKTLNSSDEGARRAASNAVLSHESIAGTPHSRFETMR